MVGPVGRTGRKQEAPLLQAPSAPTAQTPGTRLARNVHLFWKETGTERGNEWSQGHAGGWGRWPQDPGSLQGKLRSSVGCLRAHLPQVPSRPHCSMGVRPREEQRRAL